MKPQDDDLVDARTPMGNWQPIDTAPRGGKMVLTWEWEGGYALTNHPMGHARGVWHWTGRQWVGLAEGGRPTHWMPLPTPPQGGPR